MIFNEIYSAYYNTVAKIITQILSGNTDEKTLNKIVSDNAFGESVFAILPSIKSEKWQLVRSDMTTPLKNKPTMPFTLIQKEWLKAITLDPRIKLFDVNIEGLDDVNPLFTPDDYIIYDKYTDGDPYEDEKYISNFRNILLALKTGKNLKIEMLSRKGDAVYARCAPVRLEYSEKDDKFRLVTSGCSFIKTINVSRILKCRIYNGEEEIKSVEPREKYETVTLKVSEARNTLERCMLHFAHFEKRAEKADGYYTLHIRFNRDDVPEMVIRVLSFGPTVEVVDSPDFEKLIKDKLKSQKSCELF